MADQPFSKRYGHSSQEREITIREDAPREFREAILQICISIGLTPGTIREITCRVLKRLPDKDNWSSYPNIWNEVQGLIMTCEWFRVYDIVEAIYATLSLGDSSQSEMFQQEINQSILELGIGWQIIDGIIQTRGPELFESSVHIARTALESSGKKTASRELHEALLDLSRRPQPDLTGAIHHAMAALECIARDVCEDPKATLGDIMKKYPHLMPNPLNDVISKSWGYASETGRHLREGREPKREEAELVVGLSATCVTYLVNKLSQSKK